MSPDVTYTHYAISSKEKAGNIIMFAQFEEGNLWSEICGNAESGDNSDDNPIIPSLLSKEEIDAMDLGDESEDEPMSKEML